MSNILFICALAEEKKALSQLLGDIIDHHCIHEKLNVYLEQYKHRQLNVYVCQSGMGNVNASAKLALILNTFDIQQIILIGVGGALDPQLNIGDMVISEQVIQHDYCSSLAEGRFLMQPGDLILNAEQSDHYDPIIRSSPSLINPDQLAHPQVNILPGLIASGGEFVGTSTRKNTIHLQCQQALLVDMEASGIAAIAKQCQIPFIVAKTVSDKLHSDGSISQDFDQFLNDASRNAAIVGQLILQHLNANHVS